MGDIDKLNPRNYFRMTMPCLMFEPNSHDDFHADQNLIPNNLKLNLYIPLSGVLMVYILNFQIVSIFHKWQF